MKEMTTAQKSTLWLISKSEEGVRSDGTYSVNNKWHKADARTIVALVARGLLEGDGSTIRPTLAGTDVARKL